MFKSYLAVAFRNLIKNKLYSLINIVGLAVGLAACVMIALFVRDEFSYDTQWAKAERLYRLNTTYNIPGREPTSGPTATGRAKEAFRNYFSDDIAATTRFRSLYSVLRYQDKVVTERIIWTDPETADMFDLKVTAGDIHQALADKASIAIDQSFAERYFGRENPIGKILTINIYDIERDYKVAAVFEDLPENTVLDIQALVKIDEADFVNQPWEFQQWYSDNSYLYFELKEGSDVDAINARSSAFIDNSIDFDPEKSSFDKASDFVAVNAQKMTDIQLNPVGRAGSEMKPTGSMVNVVMFISIAVLILLIACINFMNLATAKSTQRAREVALRKVLGAHRGQLIIQFMGESILIALMGLVLGIAIVELAITAFGGFVGKELVLDYSDGLTLSILFGLVVFVGVIGGLYPALVLSGFLPARVLKANKSAETKGSAILRNMLVIIQFSISIGLIIATAAVYGQRLFVTTMDPGFDKESVLVIQNLDRTGMDGKQDAFRQQILALQGVNKAALSGDTPVNGNTSNSRVTREGDDPSQSMLIGRQSVGHEFFDVFDVEFVVGRAFSRDRGTDGTPSADAPEDEDLRGTLILNEAAVRRLGYSSAQEAVGQRLTLGVSQGRSASMEIIGVVRDMQLQSLKEIVRPEMYLLSSDYISSLSIKFDGNVANLISQIEKIWGSIAPTVPFEYDFIDERIAREFEGEENQSVLLAFFAGLAVLIACLGLYGLACFAAERRTKEIGIRKVMGASVMDIVRLLIWQFSKPVLIANLIAWPIVVYAVMQWLENFPYRLELWWLAIFCVASGTIALSIAWATVGGNAARVARTNPIQALRYE
jgi:putative ABC transport system permease protein